MTKEEILTTLNKILPVVARVHGDHHPELHKVLELYIRLSEAPSRELFTLLRETSGDYAVPADACPTYAKAYALLEELEKDFEG